MCLPTLSASAITKRENTKKLSATPLELHIYCIWLGLVRIQVRLILSYFPPVLFEKASTPPFHIHKPPFSLRCGWRGVYNLISLVHLSCSSKNQVRRWCLNMCCWTSRIPRAATQRWLSLSSILGIPANTECKTQITLTRGADHKTQRPEGRHTCTVLPL